MSEISNNNPLSKFFRQPAIYLKLPSAGNFWPEGSISLPVTGEIPVYPLTTKDEIILRTPDALLNGAGVVDVIQSCCPNIKDAWQTPSIDIDAILIAMRIASYGNELEQETSCPHCKETNNHYIALTPLLENIKAPHYGKVTVDDLIFKVKPQKFFGVNRMNAVEFEEEKIRQALAMPDVDSELRATELANSIQRLIDISIETIATSVDYIEMPDGTVVKDPQHIKEFFQNSNRTFNTAIQEHLTELNQVTAIKPIPVSCGHCHEEYQVPLFFDYANFFASGS